MLISHIRPSHRRPCYENTSRGAACDKVTEFTSASGKKDGVRFHLAGLQLLSSTWAETDTQESRSSQLCGREGEGLVSTDLR